MINRGAYCRGGDGSRILSQLLFWLLPRLQHFCKNPDTGIYPVILSEPPISWCRGENVRRSIRLYYFFDHWNSFDSSSQWHVLNSSKHYASDYGICDPLGVGEMPLPCTRKLVDGRNIEIPGRLFLYNLSRWSILPCLLYVQNLYLGAR